MKTGYVAHPYGRDPANLRAAGLWLAWAMRFHPGIEWQAPWLWLAVTYPEWSESMSMEWCRARVRLCDLIVLCGPVVSPGMQAERRAAAEAGRDIIDITGLAPPPDEPHEMISCYEREP